FVCLNIFSQTASIKGFIKEEETGEPIIFTSIYLKGTQYGAISDVNGYYVISKVPVGTYTLMATYMGFDSLKIFLELKNGDIISQNLKLKKSNISLKEINILAGKEEFKTETKTSVVKITSKIISQIPSIGGQPDLAQYLQVLPGVIFTGDQGGQLYIRGGSPIQNKVLLDGMVVYNPFHSIGLFSVFDTDILKNADIYTGGFGAEYGNRISSVMDISTRDGNKKRIAGKASVSPFGAKLLVEGPLKKEKIAGAGNTTFIFSAKNSYLKQTSKIFYNYADTSGLPFNYSDLYGKISINGDNGNKINFYGYNFMDDVAYRAISKFQWDSYGAGTNFVLVPSSSSVLIQGNFAYSDYKISLTEANLNPRTSEIAGFNFGLNFTYYLGKNEARWGLEMSGIKTDFNYFNSVNRTIVLNENTTEIAGFFKYKWTLGKFLIEPSFRLQYYATLFTLSPEPRLAIKYNVNNKVRIKFAGGMYSQNLISANSDRDVVNLFYGFLSGPENLQTEFNGKELKNKLQLSDHLILGVEFDPIKHFTVNIEGYYKYFPQLTNINRDKIFDDNEDNYNKPDYLKKDFIIETGNAEGVDFSLKYEYRRLYIWAVYSFGYIHKYDGILHYVPSYDRRHNVNLVTSYTFGENFEWGLDIRWNFGSGFPFTPTQGNYENITFPDGINTNYTISNGQLALIYADINSGRLPTYHRLDLTIKRHFILGKNSGLDAVFSVTNLYNRKNIFYQDRITHERVNQLPIMPSIGLNLTF
ncbi:MAG: TonB-dependent receptor plug domain-containing protein, partial [Bacteroidetes bacterium]|nr:TonB-dependent receptor plug domain-containing protein [Bacteroidota bacterium]